MSKSFLGSLTNRVLMTIAAALLVLSYCAGFINPAKAWFMMPAGLLFFPLVLLNLFLLVWAAFRRSKAFIIPLLALLPTIFFFSRYFNFSGEGEPGTGEEIKVLSYNVGRFHGHGKAGGASCEDSIYVFLKNSGADIICLQEFSALGSTTSSKELSERFPGYEIEYYLYSSGSRNFGNVILSRLPIVDKGVLKFDRSANLAVYADIWHKDRKVRVYNCHFESYNISFSGIVKSVMEKKETVIKETEEKVKRSLSLRPRQVGMVMNHISDCKWDTVLCGDFNDNPMSYTYQRLIKGHKDAFCEAGRGFGSTYSVLWPMLRIDYILVPDDCSVSTYEVPRIPFSDHYPVSAEISL